MKNFKNLIQFTLLMVFSTFIFAQDIMDIAPFDDNGDPNLVKTILGDTLDNGQRANLNRIYRLQREGMYLMERTIWVDFPLHIIADESDMSKRPPTLVRGKYSTGNNISEFFKFTKDGLVHTFKGIIFQGVDIDRKYSDEWNKGLLVSGDDISITFENCIFNAWAGRALTVNGNDCSFYFRDNIWRNGVYKKHQFGGQQNIVFATYIDTLVATNNTFFNNGGFFLFQENGIANYVLVEHNTLFTSIIDLIRMRDWVKTGFRSNLFYGTHAYGQNENERKSGWFDADEEYISLFPIDTVGVDLMNTVGLTESDRVIEVTNNAYYFPDEYKTFWNEFPDVVPPVWMNTRTQAMFDDDTNYPYLVAENNFEGDPQFTDNDMRDFVVKEVVSFCKTYRNGGTPTTDRNYDAYKGSSDLLVLPWPLPESLTYTNTEMLTGGHDGLPIGDLNWFPDKKALYVEGTVGVNEISKPFVLDFNIYPNPASDHTEVSFSLNQLTNTTLEIYNTKGDLISIPLREKLSSGDYNYNIDLTGLDSGLYFCKLKTNSKQITKKLFIVK